MSTPTLEQFQKLFTENLLTDKLLYDESEELLKHFIPMFESFEKKQEAMDRFAIYRNNVILSLSVAVGDTFPVIKRLVGDNCFDTAAIEFVRKHPPEQPSLIFYGEKFIDFIKTVPAFSDLAYLTDIALLEWNYIRAFHSEDASPLDINELQIIEPELLGDVTFTIHPSVRIMQSQWPVDTIWEENLKTDVGTIDLDNYQSSNLLIYRHEFQVQVVNLTEECFNFLYALVGEQSISDAWAYTIEKCQQSNSSTLDESELSNILGYLLNLSIFTAIKI